MGWFWIVPALVYLHGLFMGFLEFCFVVWIAWAGFRKPHDARFLRAVDGGVV